MKTSFHTFRLGAALLMLAFLGSCGEPVVLDVELKDFDKMANKLVIDARIDDDATRPDSIIVRRLGSPYEGKAGTGITGANVTITDASNGQVITFEPVPGKSGYYVAPATFVGVADDRLYTCKVVVEGTTYTARSKMGVLNKTSDTGLDSLGAVYDDEDKGYVLKLYARIPRWEDYPVYYIFKFYRNDSLLNAANDDRGAFVAQSNNELLSRSAKGVELPELYAKGSKGKMEFFGVTRECYDFWSEMDRQINTDGGLFGTPPANVKGNFDNGAFGFFQAASYEYLEKTNIGN